MCGDKARLCVLVVDDDPDNLMVITTMLQSRGYVPSGASTGNEAIAILDERCKRGDNCPDLVIVDIDLPDMGGGTLGILIREQYPRLPFIYLTAYGHLPVFVDIAKLQGAPLLDKPIDLDALCLEIDKQVKDYEQRRVVGAGLVTIPSLVRTHIAEIERAREDGKE